MKPIGNSLLNLGRVAVLPLVGLALAAPAIAQDDDPLLEEIVVVAQKREQNIMDVPVAITAVTGARIEASGIKDVFDLQQNFLGLIVGRNVTDERYYTVSFDAPLQLGRMNSYPSEPSTSGITFNKKWE
jgi:outer membrane receptor protein involved in Fe transport